VTSNQSSSGRRPAGLATRAVHAGERASSNDFSPTSTPIYPATTFLYDSMERLDDVLGGVEPGFAYTRHGNPTTRALEVAVASLEETEDALAFASGMAALHAAILGEVKSGAKIVAAREIYGATQALLTTIFETLGVETTFVDMLDPAAVQATVEAVKPRLVLVESISNPLLNVTALPAIVEIARANRATVICDNTFATPVLINPARFGVDVVVHSSTKYLGGHGDVTGGVVCTTAERVFELTEITKLVGGVPGPFEAWLALRGLKTLPLRIRHQSENAARIALWLDADPRVARVYYPGLSCNRAALAGFNAHHRGGMIAFELAEQSRAAAYRFLESLELFLPGTSLGDIYSLALYPPISTHRGLSDEERAEIGISDGLIRLSVGIEEVTDLIEDLDHALTVAVTSPASS
jgi:cystathionine beta-lyase/cystathionine gamma-synthase